MLKVKVCGLSDPGNVREITKSGPDFMGFIFYPYSGRYVGKCPDPLLFDLVPAPIIRTGVFVNENITNVLENIRKFRLGAVQLHGSETPEYCTRVKVTGSILIKSFGIDNGFDFNILKSYLGCCDYFLFDRKTEIHGGSGTKFDWEKLDEYKIEKPFFLSGGIGFNDLEPLKKFRHKKFFGVDVNSRFETSPGIKDTSRIRDFITKLKTI